MQIEGVQKRASTPPAFNGTVTEPRYIDSSEMFMVTCQEPTSRTSNHAASRFFAVPSIFLSLASCFSSIDSEYGCPDFKT